MTAGSFVFALLPFRKPTFNNLFTVEAYHPELLQHAVNLSFAVLSNNVLVTNELANNLLEYPAKSLCKIKAAAPATWGAAIEVPLMVATSLALPIQADLMLEPGANKSTQAPTFEKSESLSTLVEEPTVIADGALAGE